MLHFIRELYAFQQAVRFPAALFQKIPEIRDDHLVDDSGLILREAELLCNRPEHLEKPRSCATGQSTFQLRSSMLPSRSMSRTLPLMFFS